MQNINKITVLLFTMLLIGLVPNTRVLAQTTGAPSCLLYVYLPAIMNSQGDVNQTSQLKNQPRNNHPTSDQTDFNGDGCTDLAVGAQFDNGSSGAVNVIYGSSNGLTGAFNQVWYRDGGIDQDGIDLGGLQGESKGTHWLGNTLATGDFNNDGFTDLAMGAREAEVNDIGDAGAVQVIYGSPSGLVAAGNQLWSQDGGWVDPEGDGTGVFLGDIYGGSEAADEFGSAMTAGDFNGDGFSDLAIGTPWEDLSSNVVSGAVNVLLGSSSGLTWVGNQMWSQDWGRAEVNGSGTYTLLGDILGGLEGGDLFGNALAAGNFDNDNFDDLAIGVYGEDIGAIEDAGAIHILKGSSSGLTVLNNEHWHQAAGYIDTNGDGSIDVTVGNPTGLEEAGDRFGSSLAVGDFNGDRMDDLAVGVPREDVTTLDSSGQPQAQQDAGVVQVFLGSASGLLLTGEVLIRQDTMYRGGIQLGDLYGSTPEKDDYFGYALAAGDFDRDGFEDLAVGANREDLDSGTQAGSVNIIYGSSMGLDLPGHQWISHAVVMREDTIMGSLTGTPTSFDYFGEALTTGDYDRDSFLDLAIGIPNYTLEGTSIDSGAVIIMPGSSQGVVMVGNQLWTQNGGTDDKGNFLGDLADHAGDRDGFGSALR